jgi:hypothetical protein
MSRTKTQFKKGMKPHNKKWTDENIMKSAEGFSSRTAWSKGESGAYMAAKRQGRLDHFCAHMRSKSESLSIAQTRKYSLEDCKKDALQYRNKGQWQNAPGGFYRSAYEQGFLDECCGHMSLRHQSKSREESESRRRAKNARRRAAKLQRRPSWANEQLILAYHNEAKRLEELTGIKFHVDHIIPMQGELVSGLDVETNLQILTAHDNCSKGNGFYPELFVA